MCSGAGDSAGSPSARAMSPPFSELDEFRPSSDWGSPVRVLALAAGALRQRHAEPSLRCGASTLSAARISLQDLGAHERSGSDRERISLLEGELDAVGLGFSRWRDLVHSRFDMGAGSM